MIDTTIRIYKNRLRDNIKNIIEQEVTLNQSIQGAIESRTGGFRSLHAGQVYKFNPMNSAFHIVGDPTSGNTVGQ